ncbi:MAG: aminoacetone oxidase family FAD-binding enzyme [Bacteroidota bacterium]|nr:aminoacetone oxidase family FAD-binding enzyme [Bacteroidota bacterium]MDP4233688.1 aminoacetone oxidase family FAD-binding enzyme [Bacteroidota bacterium]MDP4241855.1 aminoacetone oxidase family FAD-binding enzyme [Bacteroidota bacterium]MDP4288957.1 aminoacetone oxidase family FAD-binding enzyme [Bacteroidota bacterium]
MTKSIAIVGGGAGGIFAALGAARTAREHAQHIAVHLFERNARLGIKILISGGGKCNITHAGPTNEVLREGFPQKNEQRFLKFSLHTYTNNDVLALLAAHDVSCHARENGRVFPNSGRADDVLAAFEAELQNANVILHLNSRVTKIESIAGAWEVVTDRQSLKADALILATGGTSYRKVGTTGDGLTYAARLGHTIVPNRAALAPIYLKHPPEQDLVGIALRDIELLIVRDKQTLSALRGDVLLTHRGLSGPTVLGISREAAVHAERGSIELAANLLGMNEEQVRTTLTDLQGTRSQQQIKTWLEELLPNRFVPHILAQARLPIDRKWHALTREERVRLRSALTHYSFGLVADIPVDRGEVTAGGVSLAEVAPATMKSWLIPNLYFAGEMLDIAGEIGGYNLQAAYSTGWVAGSAAAQSILEHA